MRGLHTLFSWLALSASLIFSPLALAATPQWVSGDSIDYPNQSYLIGRGVGSTAEEAKNRARGELATIFEVRIEVVTGDSTTVSKSGNKEQVDRTSVQQVSAKSDKVISGINIAETWRDPVTQDFHALAVLSRSQASTSLREELAKIDGQVQQNMDAANAAEDKLLKLGSLTRALESSVSRDAFQASLKVVDPTGAGVKAAISQASIQSQIHNTLKSIKITPEVAEDGGTREFATILKGGLAAAGFLASNASTADLTLVGKLNFSDLTRADGWYVMRATIEVSLVEKASGRVRGSKTWPAKSLAKDAKTARSRVLIDVEKLFKEELRATIIEFSAS